VAVHIVRGAITEYLAQRCGEILRIRGGAVADQDAVAVVGVAGAVVGDEAIERVVAIGYYLITEISLNQEKISGNGQ
jgi:hypothetical protein